MSSVGKKRMSEEASTEKLKNDTGWRLPLGLVILITGFASPLLIPVVSSSDLTTSWKTVISGALAIGIPEVFTIIAIAIMGRAGFETIKSRFFSLLKKYGPADRVSKTRYRIGLVMFLLPVLFAWLIGYFGHHIPAYEANRIPINIAMDLLLFSSLFVLGGDFWDKIRALFIHDAVVQIHQS
jgi:hypothetical protein